MELHKLPKTTIRSAKRIGRGIGSGKGGHTAGRGQKGQKSRTKVSVAFEGTKIKKSYVKRLPFLRGRGKLKVWGERAVVINLRDLANWPENTPVTTENLVKKGLIKGGAETLVKILGTGLVKKALDVRVQVSKSAEGKILKAGGKINA